MTFIHSFIHISKVYDHVPWFKPDSPLLEEEVAKSTSSLVPSAAEVFPDVVSGATPLNGHTCQFQDTICAYRSGCISSETVQDGPFLFQCVLGPAVFSLLACCLGCNSKASTKKPRWPVGRQLMPHAIRGSIAIKIPLIQGGSEQHNLTENTSEYTAALMREVCIFTEHSLLSKRCCST